MIVGLLGLIGSGKGTVAKRLVTQHGFIEDSFANTLKDVCSVLFDWPRDMLEGNTLESREWRNKVDHWWAKELNIENFSPRYALQNIGTDVLRNHFNDNLWFLTLNNRLRKYPYKSVVISDVRFPNEIEYIRSKSGILISVFRNETPIWHDMAVLANSGDEFAKDYMVNVYADVHYSEWAWAGTPVDFEIHNTSTVGKLNSQIDNIIESIM